MDHPSPPSIIEFLCNAKALQMLQGDHSHCHQYFTGQMQNSVKCAGNELKIWTPTATLYPCSQFNLTYQDDNIDQNANTYIQSVRLSISLP